MAFREDAQPNEGGRKNHTVPFVLPASLAPPAYRGRGRSYRGTPRGSFAQGESKQSNNRQVQNERLPWTPNPPPRWGSSAGPFPSPAKRRRLDYGPPRGFASSRPHHGNASFLHASSRPLTSHRPPQIVEAVQTNACGHRTSKHNIPLPPHCRWGTPNNKRHRIDWLCEQRRRLTELNEKIVDEYIDYGEGVVRWTVELPNYENECTIGTSAGSSEEHNDCNSSGAQTLEVVPSTIKSEPMPEASGMVADDPIIISNFDERPSPLRAEPSSSSDTRFPPRSPEHQDSPQPVKADGPTEKHNIPTFQNTRIDKRSSLSRLPSPAHCQIPPRTFSEAPPSFSFEHPRIPPPHVSEQTSSLLKRPPQRQFISRALSIPPPGETLSPAKGKRRADPLPPEESSRTSLPPIETEVTPTSPRPGRAEEDELSSDEEPLSRTHPHPLVVKPPVILPNVRQLMPKKPPDTSKDDEVISIASSSGHGASSSIACSAALRPQEGIVRLEGHQSRDKMRRILLRGSSYSARPNTDDPPNMYTVSMRGVVNRICGDPLRYSHTLLSAEMRNMDKQNTIDDACIISDGQDDTIVFGHRDGFPELCIARVVDQKVVQYKPLPQMRSKKGVGALCALPNPLSFASGGYDHAVHIHQLDRDLSSSPRILSVIRHTSLVQALLPLHDKSSKLVTAGADTVVNVYDVPSERVVNTFKASLSVYHLHQTCFTSCALLEVAHLEQQCEIRDLRRVPERPVVRFGYAAGETHGRYMKGDTYAHLFAGGDPKGNVRLWDIRKLSRPLATVEGLPGQKISQVSFRNPSQLVVCSEANHIRVIDLLPS